jgi:CRISPR/Cas system CMR-associated protein Cmr5 small subunit
MFSTSTSNNIKEMQIKMTLRFHLSTEEWLSITQTIKDVGMNEGGKGSLIHRC